MPRSQFVTDVSKWGLLTWSAQSRARLIISTVLATGLTVALGFWTVHYILEVSASVMLNLLIITLTMMLVLVTAFLQAVLVADIFFPGPWREHVFLGRKPQTSDLDLSVVEDHSAEFTIVIILLVLANAFGLNVATGDFLGQYHDEGFFQVRMRSDNPDERLGALEKLGEPNSYELWELEAIQVLMV